jgi:pilus assembly protein CpaE
MSRLSVVILNIDGEDSPATKSVASAASAVDMAFEDVSGTYEEILERVSNWTVLPEIVFVQAPDDMSAHEVIQDVGSRFPEGEAEMVIFNVPNDIEIYRALKSHGVREIFSGVPTEDQVQTTLQEISDENMRRTGIDPRKAVYVWSACGGAGGSALAISIAKKFAKEGRRTLYLDLDLHTGPATFMFNANAGARETSGLIDALSNPGRIDALFLERAIDIADKNLFYLSARRRNSDPVGLPEAIPILISRAQQNFDMIVIDVPWRASPQPDTAHVQGFSYVVACPTPAGLLGYSVTTKELQNAPGKSPVFGVLNRMGEFRANDISKGTFLEAGTTNEVFEIPYDANAAGRMFFEQKSYAEMSGKIRKAVERVFRSLPGEAADDDRSKAATPALKKKKKGLFGR